MYVYLFILTLRGFVFCTHTLPIPVPYIIEIRDKEIYPVLVLLYLLLLHLFYFLIKLQTLILENKLESRLGSWYVCTIGIDLYPCDDVEVRYLKRVEELQCP